MLESSSWGNAFESIEDIEKDFPIKLNKLKAIHIKWSSKTVRKPGSRADVRALQEIRVASKCYYFNK